ncbi:MAG: hypothetical protein K8R21_00185 [Leptospira sp.]|nr:hypothetical protein [Leptospira sp.]
MEYNKYFPVRSKSVFIILFTGLFFLNTLHSQSNPDPLLRNPWIDDVIEEETRFYNRLVNLLSGKKHSFTRKDIFGRNYRLKHNGEIIFNLNDSYFEVMPDSSQLDIHFQEGKTLANNGNYIEAIRVLKGIALCNRIIEKESIKDKPSNYEPTTQLLNSLLNKHNHRMKEIDILTDPYGCSNQDSTSGKKQVTLESEAFSYRLNVDSVFTFLFPQNPESISGAESSYNWKITRLVFRTGGKRKYMEDDFENEYYKSRNNLLKPGSGKIIFVIGSTFHFSNMVFNKDNYFQLWDSRRGLSAQQMKRIQFKRVKKESYYSGSFVFTDETGKPNTILMNEKYFLRGNKGIFLFLSFPEKSKEYAENAWSRIIYSMNIR